MGSTEQPARHQSLQTMTAEGVSNHIKKILAKKEENKESCPRDRASNKPHLTGSVVTMGFNSSVRTYLHEGIIGGNLFNTISMYLYQISYS